MSVTASVMAFFDAIERGQGWQVCQKWCVADASFSCQAKMLAGVDTLAAYADWMKALYQHIPDGDYDLKHHATTEDGTVVMAYAVFLGTAVGADGAETALAEDYVYVIETEGGKIRHMTKIWNDPV